MTLSLQKKQDIGMVKDTRTDSTQKTSKTNKQLLLEWLTTMEYKSSVYIAKGKEKSRLGFLPDAVVAGGFSAALISQNMQPIIISILVRMILTPLFIFIAYLWKRSGAWERELEFVTQMNPVFRRIEENAEVSRKVQRT